MRYSTANATRIIVREEGPAGIGIPQGGLPNQVLIKMSMNDYDAQWADPSAASAGVSGPLSSVDGNIALFNGNTGSVIRDSSVSMSSIATVVQLNAKVDKVAGWTLTQNNFSNADKAKLDSLSTGTFRGTYPNLPTLQAAVPVGNNGDYAYVVTTGTDPIQYIWDSVNADWALGQFPSETGATIAAKLFAEPNVNNFSDAYLSQLSTAVQSTTLNAIVLDFQTQLTNKLTTVGGVSPLTESSMALLGFTHQQQVTLGGVNYWVPLKNAAWP